MGETGAEEPSSRSCEGHVPVQRVGLGFVIATSVETRERTRAAGMDL